MIDPKKLNEKIRVRFTLNHENIKYKYTSNDLKF